MSSFATPGHLPWQAQRMKPFLLMATPSFRIEMATGTLVIWKDLFVLNRSLHKKAGGRFTAGHNMR